MSTEVKWLAYLKEECILLLPLQDTHLIDCVRVVVAVLGVDGKLMSLRREGGGGGGGEGEREREGGRDSTHHQTDDPRHPHTLSLHHHHKPLTLATNTSPI